VAHLEAYDAHSGERVWTSEPAGTQYSVSVAPVASGHLVYLMAAGSGESIHAYDVGDGSEVWHQPVPTSCCGGSAAVAPTGELFAAYRSQYYAFDAVTGDPLWHLGLGTTGGGGCTPTAGRLVYLSDLFPSGLDNPSVIVALDKDSGEIVWQANYPLSLISDVALTRDALYVTVKPNIGQAALRVLDPDSGIERWHFVADTPLIHAPVVVGDHVFVSSFTRTYAVSVATRSQVWSAGVGGQLAESDGWLLISTADGVLHAYRAAVP
jgi:outer membrane protein assembly factor BamB